MALRKKSYKSLGGKWHQATFVVIKATRKQAKLTQEQLAAQLGWHRSTIAKIESGERRVDMGEFITIAQVLKLDPNRLFDRVLRW